MILTKLSTVNPEEILRFSVASKRIVLVKWNKHLSDRAELGPAMEGRKT